MTLQRVYVHYQKLEEYHAGMWKIVRGEVRQANVIKAANLMRDIPAFSEAMTRAVNQWPNSVSHNLTVENSNRLAWLGHAGCCIGVGSPEENTRQGWHSLTTAEQDLANQAAQSVLDLWERSQEAHAVQLVFRWPHA